MDEGPPVAAKHLVLRESLKQKKEERAANQTWPSVKELRTDKQVEKEMAAHAQRVKIVVQHPLHLLFIHHEHFFLANAPCRRKILHVLWPIMTLQCAPHFILKRSAAGVAPKTSFLIWPPLWASVIMLFNNLQCDHNPGLKMKEKSRGQGMFLLQVSLSFIIVITH